MTEPQFRTASLLRGVTLLLAVGVAYGAARLGEDAVVLRTILLSQGLWFVLSSLVGWRFAKTPVLALTLLAGDLVGLGAVGAWLHLGIHPQVAFVAGYLVAILVAVVGRSITAGVLGTLAGVMVTGLTTALFVTLEGPGPDLYLLSWQIVLMTAASLLAAWTLGWLDEQARRRQITERIDREMQEREAEAAEMVTFTQSLAASGGLKELAEAVVRHLRCHVTSRARAVVLETNGDSIALWEEAGEMEAAHVQARRRLLEGATARAGHAMEIRRLHARSTVKRPLPERLDLATAVEIPVRAAGRVAGVVFVGDPRPGVLEERRLGALAEVARRAAEAVHRIERQTEQEARRTALLLRQMREGVILLGEHGHVLLVNPAARKALGCPGKDDPLPDAIGPIPLAELAETPPGISRRFRTRIQPDHERPPVELACTAVGILENHARMGTLVTLTDVTEEERARGRLVQSEKLSLVGQTLAGVAHELNNPLTALIGYSELLVHKRNDPAVQKTLQKIHDQATRATKIVKNLLNVARHRNPERSPVSIQEVAESVIELFGYEARLAGIRIDVELPPELPPLLGDRHALQQVFVNLVQNAIHALQGHGGERVIRLLAHVLPDGLVLSVSDSGPGVPEDIRSRVFEPFFTTKGEGKGTGLGLALCRSIARDHGGELFLEDRPGEGACFTLRLPLQLALPATNGQERRHAALSLGPLRVLVVDDERTVRESIVAQLGRLGCHVDSTSSAAEAIQRLQGLRYDALLVDCRMPGTGGLAFREELLRRDEDQARRIVFMTGDYANEDIRRHVEEAGNPILEKPFTAEELARTLRDHVAARAADVPKRPPPVRTDGGDMQPYGTVIKAL